MLIVVHSVYVLVGDAKDCYERKRLVRRSHDRNKFDLTLALNKYALKAIRHRQIEVMEYDRVGDFDHLRDSAYSRSSDHSRSSDSLGMDWLHICLAWRR